MAFEFGHLVVVRGKKGARVNLAVLVQVFDNGPGNAQAVESARAAAELVDEEQAAAGGVVEDIGGLVHLYHEGALRHRRGCRTRPLE